MAQRLVPTIHAFGQASRLDAVLDVVSFSARPRPLSVALDELPKRIARALDADVCSIYLLEGEDLVMRGNVGFPREALGEVRLGVGEGITGLSVEYMRPISLNAAPSHASYRHFPGTGEERFPIFLAVPIPGPSGALGALVLQRRRPPAFNPAELELAAALTAPVAAAADRARLVGALQGERRPQGPGARRITLSGRTAISGRGLGVVATFPRPEARAARHGETEAREVMARALVQASAQARRALLGVAQVAREVAPEAEAGVATLLTILQDARLAERALELAQERRGLPHGLVDLGAEALRRASRAGGEYGIERARLIAEVCEALAMLVLPQGSLEIPRGAVLIGERFGAFDLIVSLRFHPRALVLSGPQSGPEGQWLKLARVPTVTDVVGLFRWVRPGEIALIDADHGLVRLNPSRSEIALLRHEKRQLRAVPSGP